jgi:hypothetical protein
MRLSSVLAALMLTHAPGAGALERVRSEDGRLWIECGNGSLSEVLRDIAAVSPMEVWIDDGLGEERVSCSLSGVTMKEAVETIFENAKANYALYLDPVNPEKVAGIYVSSRGATAPQGPPEEPRDPPSEDLGDEGLFESPEAQEALRGMKKFLEERMAGESSTDDPDTAEVLAEIEALLEGVPEESAPNGEPKDKSKDPKDAKKPPQL